MEDIFEYGCIWSEKRIKFIKMVQMWWGNIVQNC